MTAAPRPGVESAVRASLREALAAAGLPAAPQRAVLVSVPGQRLYLVEGGRVAAEYRVSTSARGVGGVEGSYRTPPGVHRVHAKIGAGAPRGAVFVERQPTGRVWQGEPSDEDLILTRVLTLEGVESGVNCGPGCDSLERCIYIHGTNHEALLGTPASHGCVRMANQDVAELFDRLEPGDPVVVA
jgi:UDP-N-acetylmuramate--alanine ligase